MKLILISHGRFAKALLESAEMIVGKSDNVSVFGLYQGESVENLKQELEKEILAAGNPEEVLVLTDMFFGSPFNIASSLMQKYKFRHITGFNMPTLIEILTNRAYMSCDELCKNVLERQTIIDVNKYLEGDETE
jgi:PTS system mannose-specific IIA component